MMTNMTHEFNQQQELFFSLELSPEEDEAYQRFLADFEEEYEELSEQKEQNDQLFEAAA